MSTRPRYARTAALAAGLGLAAVAAACDAPARRAPPAGTAPPSMPGAPPAAAPGTAAGAGAVDSFTAAGTLPPPRETLRVPPPRPGARAPRARPRASTPAGARRPCLVERVTDGDTLRCQEGFSVRLLLIDAPEISQRPFGDQSRRALARLAPPGARVTLETDVEPRDRFGRLLAYVYSADGRMANEEMARLGYAVPLVYRPNGRYQSRVEAAATAAAAARRGLHATGGFACAPREHRRKRC